ncbi:hypothetical protein BC828DRAFT_388289 [Blastocladiella britannica]|nr:hypothetical protein BC828DRAFT_388289 [Blastocladiella britannica]
MLTSPLSALCRPITHIKFTHSLRRSSTRPTCVISILLYIPYPALTDEWTFPFPFLLSSSIFDKMSLPLPTAHSAKIAGVALSVLCQWRDDSSLVSSSSVREDSLGAAAAHWVPCLLTALDGGSVRVQLPHHFSAEERGAMALAVHVRTPFQGHQEQDHDQEQGDPIKNTSMGRIVVVSVPSTTSHARHWTPISATAMGWIQHHGRGQGDRSGGILVTTRTDGSPLLVVPSSTAQPPLPFAVEVWPAAPGAQQCARDSVLGSLRFDVDVYALSRGADPALLLRAKKLAVVRAVLGHLLLPRPVAKQQHSHRIVAEATSSSAAAAAARIHAKQSPGNAAVLQRWHTAESTSSSPTRTPEMINSRRHAGTKQDRQQSGGLDSDLVVFPPAPHTFPPPVRPVGMLSGTRSEDR